MKNIVLRQLMKVATMMGYKWETIPTKETPTKETEMPMTIEDKIVNTCRDYTRRLASDVSRSTQSEQREIFSRARTVRQIAREAGLLNRLDRACAHDSATVKVFENNDYNWSRFSNA
jgi:hypothetical protein